MSIPTTTREYSITKIGSYKNLALREIQIPKLKATEVLVKVHAVSLQFRDLAIAGGFYPQALPDGLTPCSDMAGEIIALGQEVKGWKVGDRVCANFATEHLHGDTNEKIMAFALGGGQSPGVLAEFRTFPAHALVTVPEHLSYEEASTLPCAAVTAYNALQGTVPVKAGDHVLLQGTGGVSIFGLQFAVASGAIPIVTSSSDKKLELAKKLGAKHVINYKTNPNWDEEVLKITNGRGVDHIIEVGGATLPKSLNSVRCGGFIHIVGFVSQDAADNNLVWTIVRKTATLRGIQIGPVSLFNQMNRLIAAHPEVTRPVVDKVFNFGEAIEAFAYLESQKHVGKVVIKVA